MVQSINIEGILYFPLARFFRKSLAVPHFSVKDITKIDPEKNSAGTKDDKGYKDAEKIENELGIRVLMHDRKKPGGIGAVINFFRCSPRELVMFGDRIFTDIVFGNRYGMLTVHTALLTEENDNKTAAKVRNYEIPLVRGFVENGIKPPSHVLYDESICLERLI